MSHFKNRDLSEQELIDVASAYMNQIITINSYKSIINQYDKNQKEYAAEMSMSPVYYYHAHKAMIYTMMTMLSKMYDGHNDVVSIYSLLKQSEKHKSYLLNKDFNSAPKRRVISDFDREFFEKDIGEMGFLKTFYNPDYIGVSVYLNIDDYFKLFMWKYSQSRKFIENLRFHRNNLYAHNNINLFEGDDKRDAYFKDYFINRSAVDDLIRLATDICRFIIGSLTNISKAITPINIEDWSVTLGLVKYGSMFVNSDDFEKFIYGEYK